MMSMRRSTLFLLATPAVLLAACSGNFGEDGGGGSASTMNLDEVSNGFGQLVPYTVFKLEDGEPTPEVVSIRTEKDLLDNLIPGNEILPVPKFDERAVVPSGEPGNHFIYASFTQPLDLPSVIDGSPGAQANNGLTGAITVIAIDPVTGEAAPIIGRVLVNGQTFAGLPAGDPPLLPLQTWVALDDSGKPIPVELEDGSTPGVGFPGTEASFEGSNRLVNPNTLVFVADSDGDLSSHETFPAGREIRVRVSTAVRAGNGKNLVNTVMGCTTVGEDFLTPEVGRTPPPLNSPLITPGSGDADVDPLTTVRIEFTEPIQPLSLGDLDDGDPPTPSAALQLLFGPDATRTSVPFAVRPISVFDLSTFELVPAFFFPGSGPSTADCATFSKVDIQVNAGQVRDLARNEVTGQDDPQPNVNLLSASTFFTTGEGPGLVNAPVAPDAIYAGRVGATAGISVIDLNGFGQSTGNPVYDETLLTFEEGNTYYPLNPNVRFQGSTMRPSLKPGTCTVDGGSAGVFTLTKDSSLNDRVARPPIVTSVDDVMFGHPLDGAFNNGPFPFGCQAVGGNLCALDGLKLIAPLRNINGMIPTPPQAVGTVAAGSGNIISWVPHPNPPPIIFPPLCVAPYLNVQEPTSVDIFLTGLNLLGPGDAFGSPTVGVPPSGLLTPEQNAFFVGPSLPQQQIAACVTYMIRQQVGHFLYIVDRQRSEITVLNSNRMTVVDRIPLPDPTSMSMSTDLEYIAITSQLADVVTFIDIDPTSATFHQIIKTVAVGDAPRGISWDPGNEDLLVCNEGDSTLSIISAHQLLVRKTVKSNLNKPFELTITPRQFGFGFQRGVYFAYILNRSGDVAIFESGPNGVNGWGYDDVIGVASFEFRNPKAIQADLFNLNSAVWIVHEGQIDIATGDPGPFGEGAISNLAIVSAIVGQLPLNVQSFTIPQYRDMSLEVKTSVGIEDLSGVPVDIAFDDQRNLGGEPNVHNIFSAGAPTPVNGKNLIRPIPGGFRNATTPQYAFVAVPNSVGGSGVIDVLDIAATGGRRTDTNPFQEGIQSLPASNVNVLAHYYRQ